MKAYIKVPVQERKPPFGQRVIAMVCEQNDLGESRYLWNVSYNDVTKEFEMDGKRVKVEFWLEEVSNIFVKENKKVPDWHNWDEETKQAHRDMGENYYKDADPHRWDGY